MKYFLLSIALICNAYNLNCQCLKNGGVFINQGGLVNRPIVLVVAPSDLTGARDGGLRTWSQAIGSCEDLNLNGFSDWYLPSKEELNLIFISGAGNLSGYYWSSTDNDSATAWWQHFTTGEQGVYFFKKDELRVRCVRSYIQDLPKKSVKISKKGGLVVYEQDGHGLIVAPFDLGKMNLESAQSACDVLMLNGYSDWRLPSKEELNALYVNFIIMGVNGFSNEYYWSSTKFDNNVSWIQCFGNGEQTQGNPMSKFVVRPVRSF